MKAMSWGEEKEGYVSIALGIARDWLLGHRATPEGKEIVFQTVKNLNDINRRMKIRDDRPQTKSGFWPGYTHTKQEQEEIFKQRMIDVAAGDPIDVVFGFRVAATPEEISRFEATNEVFRSCLVGKSIVRDWKILHLTAQGLALDTVAKLIGCKLGTVWDRKELQCTAIWNQVGRLLPEKKVEHILTANDNGDDVMSEAA